MRQTLCNDSDGQILWWHHQRPLSRLGIQRQINWGDTRSSRDSKRPVKIRLPQTGYHPNGIPCQLKWYAMPGQLSSRMEIRVGWTGAPPFSSHVENPTMQP